MKSRIISGAIAIAYLLFAYFYEGPELVWRVAGFLILPLACIWLSDAMGNYTGVGFGTGSITSPTPGCFVAFGGWMLLLLPIILGLLNVVIEDN